MKKLRILGIVVFLIAVASFGYFKYEQINSQRQSGTGDYDGF